MDSVNLYEAKTRLSSLVDRAAAGEEIVIAKNGHPLARLVPLPKGTESRRPAGALGLKYIDPGFDDPDPEIIGLFEGRE